MDDWTSSEYKRQIKLVSNVPIIFDISTAITAPHAVVLPATKPVFSSRREGMTAKGLQKPRH